ncbi:NPCBM/NEW2 domain-containing protein [Paenibacillus sp. CFBP 13594]|uniref:NPCBM/NEW2 domain-containing protein n=1 Tax=Paenibacillus sp. CFBP 13594 TaxID=2774037 RepID=UPI001781AC82|nr:NPCBM/NEW2 domain-containing protein [Paenibacillus sp. CFBP 13594]MBD8841990.1 NPCBM/NEW2 domain-containing protein [Paenibacillus sp. CFBP 13594]
MKDKVKGLVIGVLIGSLLTGATAFAGTNTKISVVMENVKMMFNGVHKSTAQSIVYNGNLYVPAKTAAQTMGESFTYDGKSKTASFGTKSGTFKYLDEVSYARIDGRVDNVYFKNWKHPDGLKFTIANQKYLHGIGAILDSYSFYNDDEIVSVDYNLNGGYKKLTGFIGIDDYTRNSKNLGSLVIKGDGEELFRKDEMKGGDVPEKINVDVTGVLKLQIVFEAALNKGEQIDIVLGEAKLSK